MTMRDLKTLRTAPSASRWLRGRVVVMGSMLVALLGAVLVRAVELQVHQKAHLKAVAEEQYLRDVKVPSRRGDIFDRRRVPLAQSVEVDSIWVDPSALTAPKEVAQKLGRALGVNPKELVERFAKGRRFAWVKRAVTPSEVARLKALGLPEVRTIKEPRRFYPHRELAAHLIGMVGTDGNGLDGLERSFEDELSGEVITREGVRDARGKKLLPNGVEDPQSRQGASLTLTIDRQLQYVAEKALDQAVADAQATAGMVVMLDPKTGELLALASAPRFNPNSPQGHSAQALRNRAVADEFEPGSTFKSFVIASALDYRVISEDSSFDCENGSWSVGKNVIHDTHPHGLLNPRGILQVSSNICAAKVGQRLGRERLRDTFERFGFGERTALELPGEGKGRLPFPKAEVSLATQSFGQGVTATAVQVAAAYGALANGGVLMKPYLVSAVTAPDGVVLLEHGPTVVRRVVTEKTARQVVSMLETVVEPTGTAPKARMDQYRVAGKTGTAQKVDPVAGGYSDKNIASFVGIVPAEDPRVVILVVIDEPKTAVYGGLAAAPAFKEIATQAMASLGVPPSRPAPSGPVVKKETEAPSKSSLILAIERAQDIDVVTEQITDGAVRVPDLSGVSGRVAVSQLLNVALEPHLSGSGRVVTQRPSAGTLVEKGTRVSLELASRLPPPPH